MIKLLMMRSFHCLIFVVATYCFTEDLVCYSVHRSIRQQGRKYINISLKSQVDIQFTFVGNIYSVVIALPGMRKVERTSVFLALIYLSAVCYSDHASLFSH